MDHQSSVRREPRTLRPNRWPLLAALFSVVALVSAGCRGESGLDKRQEVQASRLESIVNAAGGEWDRLSPTDREYLVRELGHGSETSARMLFAAKAGKLARPRPGSPAAPR